MKAILISIQPKWCELIANGKKTIEVRKTRPKIKTPFKCYIYCTIGGGWMTSINGVVQKPNEISIDRTVGTVDSVVRGLNGKVIGEFVCDTIYPIRVFSNGTIQYWNYYNLSKSCLSLNEMAKYIGRPKTDYGCHTGYGWHISDLVIYDEPKELSEFKHCGENYKHAYEKVYTNPIITRQPQSWCYVEQKEQAE